MTDHQWTRRLHDGWSTVRRRTSTAAAATGRFYRHRWTTRVRIASSVGLVSIGGVIIGTMLFGHADLAVGPFRAEMSISPSIFGGTEVDIPPLGSLHLDSHDGPIHLKVNLASLDQNRTEALIDDPAAISSAGENAVDDVRSGVLRLGLRSLGIAVLSAMILSALIFRNVRRVAGAMLTALGVTLGSLGLAAGTLRPDSIAEPRYEGLLVNAPAVVGDARRIADNYGRYADQLQQIVSNVSRLYTTVSTLPVYEPAGNTTRILHVSDLHLNPSSWGLIRTVVQTFEIDAVVDTGDMVDWGSSAETGYVSSIPSVGVPYIYVRGNHDSTAIQDAVARQKNAIVLDNKVITVEGLTIAGIGDPEFTPDKSETPAAQDGENPSTSPLLMAGDQLAGTIEQHGKPVDIAMVHDPAMAQPLSGVVPLVLAGHLHKREVSLLPEPTPEPETSASPTPSPSVPVGQSAVQAPIQTRLMVEGSTGGAGLRGLQKEDPTPLSLSVLYFDENHQLKAYDDIQLGGTGQSNVEMQRNVVGAKPEVIETPSTPAAAEPSR
ncbi:metallophosphoesterase family protein [Paractinoplanes durhamensis]|uniref:Membrane protein n=1 Tax=Paractinoplanes durhamensis TaxID=113563 RepID=A0ABQ3YNB8_9ACTN|nr:metallophosphoesterase [Actinoplanes durhamensis]GID99049.1 membrane protein [Actinoplanes durhamensis]